MKGPACNDGGACNACNDGGVMLPAVHNGGAQTVPRQDLGAGPCLPRAAFKKHRPAGPQPLARLGGYAPVQVQAVGAAVQGSRGLVQSRLLRHEFNGALGNIGGVGQDHVNGPEQPYRERRKQVPAAGVPVDKRKVPLRAGHGDRVHIRGMEFAGGQAARLEPKCHGNTKRTGAAAQINHDWRCRGTGCQCGNGLANEEDAAAPGHKHSRGNGHTETIEFGPAHDVFQWLPVHAAGQHPGQLRCRAGRLLQDGRFLFGIDTPAGTQRSNEFLERGGAKVSHTNHIVVPRRATCVMAATLMG